MSRRSRKARQQLFVSVTSLGNTTAQKNAFGNRLQCSQSRDVHHRRNWHIRCPTKNVTSPSRKASSSPCQRGTANDKKHHYPHIRIVTVLRRFSESARLLRVSRISTFSRR